MNLLIVDDDIIALRSMMSGIDWTKCGIDGDVWTTHNAKQAEQILERETVDIVLCDIEMPGKNGLELIQTVQAEHPEITVIFLTCHAKFEYAKEAIRLGCREYILTPAPFETIADTVKSATDALREKRKRQELEKLGSLWVSQHEKKAESAQGKYKDIAELIHDTEAYILANLGSEELSVASLAKRTFLHEDYLNRMFKREKGVSLNQYMIGERMKLAMELLQTPSLGISVIAAQVGYVNYSYFVSTFKKTYGYPPAQYRKEILKIEG